MKEVIAFTGTRLGMTEFQKKTLKQILLAELDNIDVFMDGCCVGSDAEAFDIATELGIDTHGYPGHPYGDFKNTTNRDDRNRNHMNHPFPFFSRNRTMVELSTHVLATPANYYNTRGGTWYTINYAKQQGKPLTIIYPDGLKECFNIEL